MKDSENLSIEEFVLLLWKELGAQKPKALVFTTPQEILHYGHIKGWLEDQDESECNALLNKRTAARIFHQFMKIELLIPDEEKIEAANSLKDLYTCRVCANHIAQIYVKKIMNGEEAEENGQIVSIFNSMRLVTKKEILESISKISFLINH